VGFTLAGGGGSTVTVRGALDEATPPQQVVEASAVEASASEAPLEADPTSGVDAYEAAEEG
jgi:hypothetical protein